MNKLYMVFDVESVGLQGEGYAVGYVVVDGAGNELEAWRGACSPDAAQGGINGRAWIAANTPVIPVDFTTPHALRNRFWAAWERWEERGAVLVADCAWPVEARFLAACVDDELSVRSWQGPYPLHDVATARLLAGFDPLATVERLPTELPQHDPLADARQSARLWLEALNARA
ncbi:hypothetical protein SE17_33960 [Kouleothrix aurantiaca]|uniref:Uncharacterized protein n=1 Tax=Kouleothrix aurantiaca TaxID=186479 RepID=A0A0P9H5N1_9CHLR|nr:hypothetical protein SE17_33960 [Kouleothrix aurantiaca]